MLSRTIFGLLVIACFSYGHQPPTPSKPTTDDERYHATLHAKLRSINAFSGLDLKAQLAASPAHHVITYLETPMLVESPNPPKTAAEWVQYLTCQSNLVVLGYVTKQVSSLSENTGIVFSDYYFQVNETLFTRLPTKMTRVVVVLPGGRVEEPDGIIETRFKALHGIPVGGPPFHLLFLLHNNHEGMPDDSFHLAHLFGSFFLFPDHAKNFSSAAESSLPGIFEEATREQMIQAVKQSSSVCGGSK
jgi:hypothetical protein